MKHSVRFKLFVCLSGVIVLFVLFSFALNSLFLERYYEQSKKASLVDIFATIKNNYTGNIDVLSEKLEKDESLHQVHILIEDKDFNIVYSSPVSMHMADERQKFGPSKPGMPIDFQSKIKDLSENPTVEKRNDSHTDPSSIDLYGKITVKNEPVYVVIMSPTAAISASASIANQFYLFTGILTLIVGGILIYFISKRVTKPIVEVSSAAKRLSGLDFSDKIKIKSDDEIGQLGQSFNELSEKLEKSITSLRQANLKLLEDLKEKENIDTMRKEFVSNVSHELKTPISLIMGYAEGLKVNVNEREKDYYCDVIADEAEKMNKLVMKLLDLAQLESGFFDVTKTEFDVQEQIQINLEKNKILLEDKKMTVQLDCRCDPMVNADYDLTNQVFSNIFVNAVNHTDERGVIRMSIDRRQDKIRVSVYNSGKQIPQDSLDKVWESFYKVDKARTREYGGSGLGLKIVKTIMDADQNKFGVQNLPEGVEFWFELDSAQAT